MRKTHCRTRIMARKLKNMENETHTCMTLNMARNTEKGGK